MEMARLRALDAAMRTASMVVRIKAPAVNKIARRERARARTARLQEPRTETARMATPRGPRMDQALAETAAAELKSI
jgi:hypothetical protein